MRIKFASRIPKFSASYLSLCREEGWVGSGGFTLIEMITVIVILCIVGGIAIKFLSDSLRIYTMTANQKTLYDEAKLALERMCRDIRDAQSITSFTAGPPGSIVFVRTNATAYDQVGETITFQQNAAAGTHVKIKSLPSASTNAMAQNVTSFTVANTTNKIQLQLTLQSTFGSNTLTVTLATKVYPKNLPEDTTGLPPTYKNFRIRDSSGNYTSWQEVLSP